MLRLLWRSIKSPEYRRRWLERFAIYSQKYPQEVIWFHAVSVGEAEALFPLVRQLHKQFPQQKLLVTTTTPTGSARVSAVLGNTVEHVYLPYDVPIVVGWFMRCFKPKLAVIMETEIWPNLFCYCGVNNIPLYLINARLSEKSRRGYSKLPALIHPVLASIKQIAAQTQDDAERYLAIGAKPRQVVTFGNIKFDLVIPGEILDEGKKLKASLFKGRFVWLAASSHKGEEALFMGTYQALKPNIPSLLLVIVPRHPERFAEVSELGNQHKLKLVTRTAKQACSPDTDVYLADTMGELKMLYAAADIAFIGGSMVPVGGHNLLEAAAIGVPILFGPYMANFKEIAKKVLADKAAIQCQDQNEIIKRIQNLYSDSQARDLLIENGKAFVETNRGALEKIYQMLVKELDSAVN